MTVLILKARVHNESEEDVLEGSKRRSKQIVKSPKKKKIKKSPEKTIKIEKSKEKIENKSVSQEEKLNETIDSVIKLYESGETKGTEEIALAGGENEINDSNTNQIKPVEEATEWDCTMSVESVDVKHSPEHSAESGSGKFLLINIGFIIYFRLHYRILRRIISR